MAHMIYSKIFQGYQGIVIDIGNRELDKPVSLRSRGPKQRKNNHKLIIPAAAYYANAYHKLSVMFFIFPCFTKELTEKQRIHFMDHLIVLESYMHNNIIGYKYH